MTPPVTRSSTNKWWDAATYAAWTLIGIGLLLALFVVYQLWFTNVLQSRHQSALENAISHVVPQVSRDALLTSLPVGPAIPLPVQTQPRVGAWLGEIEIPTIHLRQAIVQGVGENQLSEGPGHYPSTPGLGEAGNVAIAGHRTTWGHPFRYLNELQKGDPIVIVTPRARLLYRVLSYSTVSPNDVGVLDVTSRPTLTLTTCTPPYSAASRLILRARLVAVQRLAPLSATQRRQIASSQATFVQPSSTSGAWPIVLFSFLFIMFVLVAIKWWRETAHKIVITTGIVVVSAALLFELFGAVSAQLPPGF